MAPALSIILPVYNVEGTLDECVRSVLACCGADAQVVLVDDGSPDACPQMCDEWAARDARIEVVHRPNGGLSAARNSGLSVARGTWIAFVDSDDVVNFDFDSENSEFSECSEENIDIIEFPVRRHWQGRDEVLLQWGDRTYASATDYWLETQGWTHCYAWNKVFRRSLFDGVRFPVGRVFEDVWTIPILLKRARAIRTTTCGWYGYRDNPSGITMTAGGLQLADLLQGNINSVRVMGVCNVHHYAAMLNTQLDVFRATGRIMLQRRRFGWRSLRLVSWDKRIKLLLPLALLCRLHKAVKAISRKP